MKLTRTIIAFAIAATSTFAAAQTPATSETTAATTSAATSTTNANGQPMVVDQRTVEARQAEFEAVLDQYPPAVGRVLKLSPSLFSNEKFMSAYPALSAYIAQHPEVAQNPAYFLQNVYAPEQGPKETAGTRMTREILEGISIFAVMSLIATVLMWLIRTIIDHRRWSRVSRTQAEVHIKMLDRFASSEELITYINTPAGAKFLESAPIQLPEPTRALSAPTTRVMWPLQIGVVLAAAGIGLQFVSGRVDKEVADALFGMSVLAISLGFGFIAAAFVAYAVSRKLGLWAPAAQQPAAD
jgi:hypothetical protein